MNAAEQAKLIERGNNCSTSDKLLTFYENVKTRGATPRVLAAIEERMWREFPTAARLTFGAKEEHVMEVLTRLASELTSTYDFSENKVGNHVKTGGVEISGADFLCRYLSYKNSENQGAQITLSQSSFNSELVITVDRYQTNSRADNFRNGTRFTMEEFDSAVQLYRQYLDELGMSQRPLVQPS